MNTSLEELAVAYAANRTRFRRSSEAISDIAFKSGHEKALMEELGDCRKGWYEYYEYEDGDCGAYGEWQGWVTCVELAGYEKNDDEHKLAVLLDNKSVIKQQAGHIKRAFCARGRKLIRNKS